MEIFHLARNASGIGKVKKRIGFEGRDRDFSKLNIIVVGGSKQSILLRFYSGPIDENPERC